jgi:DNA (cytosine-5)-methyltransferase 1
VSDIDKGACKILAHRFPGVPNLGDITTVDWSQVEPVDVLTGGSPCQDLSHAGKRAGMTEGTRSNLWVAMREAIAQLRPGLVVWENVRGAYSAEADSELERPTTAG